MAKHRTHCIEFKRQIAQEFLAGETLHGLAKRHDICRNLIRVWVQKYEAGDFDEDAATRRGVESGGGVGGVVVEDDADALGFWETSTGRRPCYWARV